jgi:hypothetical protein
MRVSLLAAGLLGALAGCTFPQTRMEPSANYGSGPRYTISAAPANTAGPSYVRTTSPDGATRFVCAEGGSTPASRVPPETTPAC